MLSLIPVKALALKNRTLFAEPVTLKVVTIAKGRDEYTLYIEEGQENY